VKELPEEPRTPRRRAQPSGMVGVRLESVARLSSRGVVGAQFAGHGQRLAVDVTATVGYQEHDSDAEQTSRGTIVNISSVAGRRGWANASAYCATRFGLTGLTQAIAAEGAPHGVRVVCLYPGAMATHCDTWNPADRGQPKRAAPEDALAPADVADYIAWLVQAPAHLVLTETVSEAGPERPRSRVWSATGWLARRAGSSGAVGVQAPPAATAGAVRHAMRPAIPMP